DRFAASTIRLVEIPPGENGYAKRRKKTGRNRPEPRAWILLTRRPYMPVRRELETRTEVARVAPWDGRADGNALHPRQPRNASHVFLVEVEDTLRSSTLRHHRDVQREHVVRVEAAFGSLQREQRFEQYACAGPEYERGRDLNDGERVQLSTRGTRDPQAAIRQAGPMRRVRCRQARNIRQQYRRDDGQQNADP